MRYEDKLNNSPLLKLIKDTVLKIDNLKKESRKLKEDEKGLLIKNNNFSNDWDKVNITDKVNLNNIRNNIFCGEVIISAISDKKMFDKVNLASGIYNSTISDSVLDAVVLIKDVKQLNNYYIGEETFLLNNGIITSCKKSHCGNGTEISIGIETGGRELLLYSEIAIDEASRIVTSRGDKEFQESYNNFIKDYTKLFASEKGIILGKAEIINTKEIRDTFIDSSAVIKGAALISNTTILSNEDEKTEIKDGAYIKNSIIQWGCEVTSMGIVSESALTEHTEVERHGKVTESILGPNTGVAEGEVTACILGPFVGFHHQALLIGALWEEGKGNVAYGANVGSNHTAKAPDQEIIAGEGMFFGLGVSIKFPANFVKAAYSIIATGVTTLPQKIDYPFSLINFSKETILGISPAYNDIMPGWVLYNNIYMVKRNEGKYAKRNKAKRTEFTFEVFRPDIIELMKEAKKELESVKEKKEVYTSKDDIKGLGKNYLSELNRIKGIDAYRFYIQYYALKGLFNRVKSLLNKENKVEWSMIESDSDDKRWEHEKGILDEEFSSKTDIKELLNVFLEYEIKIADDVYKCKEKDDIRGRDIIDDYDDSHTLASDDGFVCQVKEEVEEFKKELNDILKKVE